MSKRRGKRMQENWKGVQEKGMREGESERRREKWEKRKGKPYEKGERVQASRKDDQERTHWELYWTTEELTSGTESEAEPSKRGLAYGESDCVRIYCDSRIPQFERVSSFFARLWGIMHLLSMHWTWYHFKKENWVVKSEYKLYRYHPRTCSTCCVYTVTTKVPAILWTVLKAGLWREVSLSKV